MKKQKTYVAMLLVALVILSLAGCGMKNSKDNAEATTGWSVENPDNTTKDKKTTESTDAEDNIEEDADGIMDNLGAGTFDTYEDAKNYLMDKDQAKELFHEIFNKLNVDSMCFLGEEESHMMRENISYIRCIFLLFYLKGW